jgi:hypothetical protein
MPGIIMATSVLENYRETSFPQEKKKSRQDRANNHQPSTSVLVVPQSLRWASCRVLSCQPGHASTANSPLLPWLKFEQVWDPHPSLPMDGRNWACSATWTAPGHYFVGVVVSKKRPSRFQRDIVFLRAKVSVDPAIVHCLGKHRKPV